MSVPPFSRPGAVDLSSLKAAQPAAAPTGVVGGATGGGAGAGGSGAYAVDLSEENFQAELQRSAQVPVVVSFWSPQVPASVQLNTTLDTLADEFGGRFLFAKLDVDAHQRIAEAVGVPGAPLVAVALGGQLAPLTQEPIGIEELRRVLDQVVQTAVSNGMTGRVEPRQPAGADTDQGDAPATDPKYAEAEEALSAGDLDAAVAAYERVLQEQPGDAEARTGLARTRLVARTRQVDLQQARAAAAADPADVDAQLTAADVDLLGGHIEDAFDRLVQTVRRVAGDDRTRVRTHLVELFEIVGNDDPLVLTFRTRLANALF